MSRTHRSYSRGSRSCYFRRPKTSNERKQLLGLLYDIYDENYDISGINHLHRRFSRCPTSRYDQVISAYFETYHDEQ